MVADVDNVANVDFLLNLFDCPLAKVQTQVNCPVILRSQAL